MTDFRNLCPDCLDEKNLQVELVCDYWGGDDGPPQYYCPVCGEDYE